MTMIDQHTARSIVKSIGDDSRSAIVARARKLRDEIAQTFAAAEHWNRVNAPWKGPAIDPDPDGQLKRLAQGLDRMLAAEPPVYTPGDHHPVEWGPSTARRLTCSCGDPGPGAPRDAQRSS